MSEGLDGFQRYLAQRSTEIFAKPSDARSALLSLYARPVLLKGATSGNFVTATPQTNQADVLVGASQWTKEAKPLPLW